MKRLAIFVGIVLVLGFVGVSVWRGTRRNPAPETEKHDVVSAERKEEVQRFWDLYRRATDLRIEGEWVDAASLYTKALEINSQHEGALYHSGNVFFELGEYDRAVTAWRRLAEAHPLSARAHFQLGAIYSSGAAGADFDLDIAEREFQRALAINQEETGPIQKLGELNVLRGESQRALTFFEKVLKSNPKSIEAHYMIGYIKWWEGDRGEALASLQQAVTHSLSKGPAGAVLGEGDTKTGSGPLLVEGASRKSFFSAHWISLKSWSDEEVSTLQMEEEYSGLDQRLELLTGKAH